MAHKVKKVKKVKKVNCEAREASLGYCEAREASLGYCEAREASLGYCEAIEASLGYMHFPCASTSLRHTEIVNNAIDHSNAKYIDVYISFSNHSVDVKVSDNGVGAFKNIMRKFGYSSELESIQQLLKGKLTTLPDYHSGQGIFFSTKAANFFEIVALNTNETIQFMIDRTEF
ncbi:hypothetical protein KKD03_03455 [Patescibacteria group bacterium]|nr:hypothetical protein [Patescibacteria group bacterium]